MTSPRPPIPPSADPPNAAGSGHTSTVSEEGRTFPCEECGADLEFHIGVQSLKCPYCGHVKAISLDPDAVVAERDFREMLANIADRRSRDQRDEQQGFKEVRCASCGGTVRFTGTLTSSQCAYCGGPLQLDNVHDSADRIPVDGVLAFQLDRRQAWENLRSWIKSRWFAPSDFKKYGIEGRFNGVYLPFWTFDALTHNRYVGLRGEHYWVTVGSGKSRRRVMRTRWYPASGAFQRFFDDVLVVAGTGLPTRRLDALEPWPLKQCVPFRQEMLSGFLARTYDVELDAGFDQARTIIDAAVADEVRRRIGGDVQQVQSVVTRYDAVTYKHLLLPVWMLAYRFRDKPYQVVVNAGTGEVQGDRPYSGIKITLAVLAGLAATGTIALFVANLG